MNRRRVVVKEIIASRYAPGKRPARWNERVAGIDEVETTSGEHLSLLSEGDQSSPAPGWELLLNDETGDTKAVTWTLYGIS